MITKTIAVRFWATARRHRPRVWLLWAAGTILLLASQLAIADPGVLMFVLDPELLALIVASSIALLRPAAADLIAGAFRASIGSYFRRRPNPTPRSMCADRAARRSAVRKRPIPNSST
jgi:hypothetical protein